MDDLVEKAINGGRRTARSVIRKRNKALVPRRDVHAVPERSLEALGVLPEERTLKPRILERLGGRSPDHVLVAEGDSWFDYPWNDVLSRLEDGYGYEVEDVARYGHRVEDMAYRDGQLENFIRKIEKVLRRGEVPKAILLSAGGNDIAGDDFHMLLNHRRSAEPGINQSVAAGVIDERVMLSYAHILAQVSEACRKRIGRDIPVVVHGYDYAVADGRGYGSGWGPLPGPWLEPGFEQKGYDKMTERRRIIRSLIDRFNDCLIRLSSASAFAPFVHYVDLRGTLPDTPKKYKEWWANELHPTKDGFTLVARKLHKVIDPLP